LGISNKLDSFCRSVLIGGYQLDLQHTRLEYNVLGSLLFLGSGVIGILSVLILAPFPWQDLILGMATYSIFIWGYQHLRPPGFPLWLSILHVPLGLLEVMLLHGILPLELIHFCAYTFPLAFVFTFHYHSRWFVGVAFALTFLGTALIVAQRGMPNWEVYLLTTFGGTLIIGLVVHQTVAKVLALANYDSLTGLMNRRHWEATLHHLMAMNRRDGKPLSVVFFDLDNFKRINDKGGHAAGDAVLKRVSQQLRKVSRGSDSLGRWGGDEFAIALPNTTTDQAYALVRRLQAELGDVGISTGVVQAEKNDQLEILLQRADKAMYAAKQNRNTSTRLVDQRHES